VETVHRIARLGDEIEQVLTHGADWF
jgi:hypothetical protein